MELEIGNQSYDSCSVDPNGRFSLLLSQLVDRKLKTEWTEIKIKDICPKITTNFRNKQKLDMARISYTKYVI